MHTPCPHCDQTTPHTIEKYCTQCDQTLPHTLMAKNSQSKDGLRSVCKAHWATFMREHYGTHKEAFAIRSSTYKKAHRPELNKKERERRQNRLADPILGPQELARHRQQQASYLEKHPERAKASVAKYGSTHKDSINARRRQRYAEDPTKPLANSKKRKALRRGASVSDLTPAQWEATKAHYGYRCVYCGRKTKHLTQDHITPVSQGGPDTYSNIVPACRSCNAKKGTGAVLKPIQPLLLL